VGQSNVAVQPEGGTEPIAGSHHRLGVQDPQIQFQKEMTGNAETLRITSPYGTGEMISSNLTEAVSRSQIRELGR